MGHLKGAGSQRADRVDFDRRVGVAFRGAQISSDGGLLVMRDLDDALGLSDLAAAGPICPVQAASAHAGAARGGKCLSSDQVQSTFTSDGLPLEECRL